MLAPALYILLLLIELFFAFSVFVYIVSLLYSSFKGAPYVPTKKDSALELLEHARLQKGQKILELGCGDGRVIRTAVETFKMKGVGIDINRLLIWIARFKHRKFKRDLSFKTANVFKTPLSGYNVIYLFLMPEMLVKLKEKFTKECKRGTLIISHGFKIDGWDGKINHTLVRKPFPTYYYRV